MQYSSGYWKHIFAVLPIKGSEASICGETPVHLGGLCLCGHAIVDKAIHGFRSQALADLCEPEFLPFVIEVEFNPVTSIDLVAGNQIREWMHQEPLDGPFQVARPIFSVRTFPQQECIGRRGRAKHKLLPVGMFRIRRCTCPNSRLRMQRNSPCPRGRKTAVLSIRLINSGVNLRRAASTPFFDIFEFNFWSISAGLPRFPA
jgi:hypothetical protein